MSCPHLSHLSFPPDVCSVLVYSLNSLTSEYSSNAACSMQGGLEGVHCSLFILYIDHRGWLLSIFAETCTEHDVEHLNIYNHLLAAEPVKHLLPFPV